jgi:fructokinase
VSALHFGSISLVREPGASAYEALMRREHGRRLLSLDPNVRPSLVGDRAAYTARLEGWVAVADLVKVSRADLDWLYPDRAPEAVAEAWLAGGPAMIVVTGAVTAPWRSHGQAGWRSPARRSRSPTPWGPATASPRACSHGSPGRA